MQQIDQYLYFTFCKYYIYIIILISNFIQQKCIE